MPVSLQIPAGTKKYLSVISSDNYKMSFQDELEDITAIDSIVLRGEMDRDQLQFQYSTDGMNFKSMGHILDAAILSDDHVRNGRSRYRPAFTGSFVGICCQDLEMNAHHADFKWFEYKEIKE